LLLALPLAAAETNGAQYWSAADLKAYQDKLAAKVEDKVALEEIINGGGPYFSVVAHVEGIRPAEMHEEWADVYMIISGSGAVEVGGDLENAKTTAPGELRGGSIRNGKIQKVSAGDLLHIPPKTPHRVLEPDGQITYIVFKVKKQ
jgi:mannose-6-phosphate isomerase-like protein (cupin superfamily)